VVVGKQDADAAQWGSPFVQGIRLSDAESCLPEPTPVRIGAEGGRKSSVEKGFVIFYYGKP